MSFEGLTSKKNLPSQKIGNLLDLKFEKTDCYVKERMLYYKDNNADVECRFYHEQQYVPRKTRICNYKDVPVKRMFYMLVTSRLKSLIHQWKLLSK